MKFLCEILCFSPIAVDPQVGTTEGKTFDIIFVGTTRGRVIKVINAQAADSKYELKNVRHTEIRTVSLAAKHLK